MKFSFQSEHLQKVLPSLNRVISTKTQLPILLNFYISVRNGILYIRATDLEIGIEVSFPVLVEEEGDVTVPAKLFSELISSLSQEKITIQTEGETIEVISKKTKSILNTIPAEDFPQLYDEKGEKFLVLSQDEIEKKLTRVVFAASIDTQRPALSGVLIRREESELLLVATDGYRLSLEKLLGKEKPSEEEQKPLLVPVRTLKELILSKSKSPVSFSVSKKNNQIIFSYDATTLIGRLIDAEYPQFEKIIPSDYGSRVEFDTEEMQKAIKLCSFFARDSANIIKFSLTKEAIVVSANTPSVGKNTVEVEARLTGEENQIAFNARYLMELFQNINEKEMIFEMTGPLSPGVFKLKEDPSFLHIIMPIRVQTETD